jgi:hypothetical protein
VNETPVSTQTHPRTKASHSAATYHVKPNRKAAEGMCHQRNRRLGSPKTAANGTRAPIEIYHVGQRRKDNASSSADAIAPPYSSKRSVEVAKRLLH